MMRYRAKLSTRAERSFQGLGPYHKQLVGDWIIDLMENPHGFGRPTPSPPSPPGGLLLEFADSSSDPDLWYVFRTFFTIDDDDEALLIAAIGYSEYSRDEEWPSDPA